LASKFPPPFKSAAEGDFVGKFEAGARWQPMSDSGDSKTFAGKTFAEVKTGGITLDVGAERDNNLSNSPLGNAAFQFGNTQIFGLNPVERRDFSTQDVILAAKGSGFLNAQNIDWAFDQANQRSLSTMIAANVAGGFLSEGTADFAEPDQLARAKDCIGQQLHGAGLCLHQMQRDAFSRTRTDARQFAERADQV
jgi:hypothetical protein